MFQMRRDAIEAVCPEGAVLAALVPVRAVHEVIGQQLAAALEQLRKGLPPSAPSKTYSFSTFTHGSARRSSLSWSRCRVNSFSLARSRRRAASHSSCETIE